MKTLLFTILLKGWDIINQQIFHSKILKNHACNPNLFFDASNDPKYQKVIQNGLQRGTQKSSKIIENPSRVHLCASVTHLIAKMVNKWCPRTSKWSQNGHPKTLKGNENQQNPRSYYVTKQFTI